MVTIEEDKVKLFLSLSILPISPIVKHTIPYDTQYKCDTNPKTKRQEAQRANK